MFEQHQEKEIQPMKRKEETSRKFIRGPARRAYHGTVAGAIALGLAGNVLGSENAPHLAFAQWADVPLEGQFVAGLVYQESEAYHIWTQHTEHGVDWRAGGEHYGIDINQGFVALQYGLTKQWAFDLEVGYTTSGWRYFTDPNTGQQGAIRDTTGLMDTALGVRYQIFKEGETDCAWLPTLTFRAGAI